MHNGIRVARRLAVRVLGGVRIGGRVLEAHQHADLDGERLLVEFERLLGAAVEEQVNLRLHQYLPFAFGLSIAIAASFSATPSARRPPCDGRSPGSRRS